MKYTTESGNGTQIPAVNTLRSATAKALGDVCGLALPPTSCASRIFLFRRSRRDAIMALPIAARGMRCFRSLYVSCSAFQPRITLEVALDCGKGASWSQGLLSSCKGKLGRAACSFHQAAAKKLHSHNIDPEARHDWKGDR